MEPKPIFYGKMKICEACGNNEFEGSYFKKELSLSDNYVFYTICKKCGAKYGFHAKVERIGRGIRSIHYSEITKIERRIPEGSLPIL